MKNLIIIFLTMLFLTSCTIHVPYDDYSEPVRRSYRVWFKVQPDDASVYLNDRFVGEAYEFSTYKSALVLNSRNNTIVVTKKGFKEEEINLYDYNTHQIKITLIMTPVGQRSRPVVQNKEDESTSGKEDSGVYIEKEREVPAEKFEKQEDVKVARVILKVYPSDVSIYVDQKFWGTVPSGNIINNMRLVAGEHSIDFVKPGYEKKSVKRIFKENGGNKIEVRLKKSIK